MELIKRRITSSLPIRMVLHSIGFNSNEVLTLCFKDGGEDLLINLNGEDLNKLKKFLQRID